MFDVFFMRKQYEQNGYYRQNTNLLSFYCKWNTLSLTYIYTSN